MTGDDGKELQPVFGEGLTGLRNLGNRSALQRPPSSGFAKADLLVVIWLQCFRLFSPFHLTENDISVKLPGPIYRHVINPYQPIA